MKRFCYVAVVTTVLITATRGDVIGFEDLPASYQYLGGGQNIGSYYSGVNLGPNVTGLDATGLSGFPAHSGSIVVWNPIDNILTITFASPQSMVGIWYTSLDFLTITALDASNTVLSSSVGSPNSDGTTGVAQFLSVASANIGSITLTGSPGQYVFDDLTFTPQNSSVPEPSSISLFGVTFVAMWFARRGHWRGIG